jgi:hypothetical protein
MNLVIEGSLMLADVLNGHPQEDEVRQLQRDNLRQMLVTSNILFMDEDELQMPFKAIAQPHLTILSSRDLKPLQKRSGMSNKAFREWMKEVIPTLPPSPVLVINTRKIHTTTEDEKTSAYLRLSKNGPLSLWREEIMEALGVLVEDIDTSRFFHISIANLTGNPHDSVAKPKWGATMWSLVGEEE